MTTVTFSLLIYKYIIINIHIYIKFLIYSLFTS